MPLKKATATVSRALTAIALAIGATAVAPQASAQVPPELQAVAAAIPGAPQLPDLPGLPGVAGAADAVHLAAQNPAIAGAIAHSGASTPDPAVEQSTNPTCAPLIMVAVPGTFEINRDYDPNKPVGLLGHLAEPLRAMGPDFSETYINYPADAGVSGTAYAQSVQKGAEKTLATIVDIQNRCQGSRVLLSGWSQGADVAGDVATMIGSRQTEVRPDTMAGVVLFADPQRDENANVLVGTSNEVPEIPGVVGDAVEQMLKNPSIGQMQMNAGEVSGIAKQLLGGDNGPAPAAGSENKPEMKPSSALETNMRPSFVSPMHRAVGLNNTFVPASKTTTLAQQKPVQEQPKAQAPPPGQPGPQAQVLHADAEPAYNYTDDEHLRDAADGIIVPGSTGLAPRPAVHLLMNPDEKKNTELGRGQVWATPENLELMQQFNTAFTEKTGIETPKELVEGTQDTIAGVLGSDLNLHHQVGDVYRAGACGELTFEDCVSFFSGAAGMSALAHQVKTLPEKAPDQLAALPTGNLMETACATTPAGACAQLTVPQESTLPTVTYKPAVNTSPTDSVQSTVPSQSDAPKDEIVSDNTSPQATSTDEGNGAGVQKAPSSAPAPAAGGENAPAPQPEGTNTPAPAGGAKKPKESTSKPSPTSTPSNTMPQAGEGKRPTDRPYEGTLGGATNGKAPQDGTAPDSGSNEPGEKVEGVNPITMAAVAGGGVAGPRDHDFGDLKGSVVSLCVPGDIVCSLPENSQLARDLVQIGQQVSTNIGGIAKEVMAGNTRMGGLLAVEAVNVVFQLSGLPPIKLSPQTLEMLLLLVSGAGMIAAGDPTGAGVGMIATAMTMMPQALPELWALLQDIPEMIEKLPDAPGTLARNLGLTKIKDRIGGGFKSIGANDITDVASMPPAAGAKAASLLADENSGLMELATNPDYLKTGAHSLPAFEAMLLNDQDNSVDWTQGWWEAIRKRTA